MTSSLEELERLAKTANAEIMKVSYQILNRYHPATLIGSGKVLEIAELARKLKATTVIFDHELSAAQQKNLESACRVKILDRSRLILDIFAKRARTSEGRIQVELAQLSYLLPRLTGAWRGFSQQVGGIGTRGPGERKLEYERRHIQLRINHLKHELKKVESSRAVRRKKRNEGQTQISLVGYTNVGKSTLLNALSKSPKSVYADNKLFATLDPTSRRVWLPSGSQAVLTDTVGFIQRLPPALVLAFRATLEEIPLSDCLYIVSDATSENIENQDNAVAKIMEELGATKVPQIKILNKLDSLDFKKRAALALKYPDRIFISAKTGEGINDLLDRTEDILHPRIEGFQKPPDFS